MNRDRYRTVFCRRLGMLIAVAEIARAQGKGSGRKPGSGTRATPSAPGAASFVLATMSMLSGGAALAGPPLPTGGEIVSGGGTISQNGATLTVNQSTQSLAANWQSFDIDAGHSVVFNQPNNSSVALNRVIGPEASSIYGNLSANGKVFLVNPNGVLFAPGAQVSVGGLVASTLSISDEDFAAGRYRFTHGNGAGNVVNEGAIDAGSVALIGPKVVNSGTIQTPGGRTTFAAGDQVTVSLMDGLITAQVDAAVANAEIQNHGEIVARGGQVHLLAGRADSVVDSLINTDGVIRANSIRNENGKVFLDAGAGGTANVNGVADASGVEAGAHGGDVTVLGKHIALWEAARIEASGDAGGGTVLVGGNWQGKGPEHNAEAVYMDRSATIRANAVDHGDGGTVVLWSDKYTGFYGNISARGGANGGNGGQVETSSHENLQAMGSVDATSPAGKGGAWLLDPSDITISNSATSGGGFDSGTPTNVFTPGVGASSSTVNAADIVNSLNNGTSVTIQTNSTGTGGGDIDVAAAIAKTNGADATLRLNADRNIRVRADITSSSNRLNIILNSHYSSDAGSGLVLMQNATLNSNGGNITIGGGSTPETMPARGGDVGYVNADPRIGVFIVGSTVNAAGGNIIINGEGLSSPSGGFPNGIATGGATIMTSGTGTIRMTGTAGVGGTPQLYFDGIQLSNTDIHTEHGTLDLIGTGSDWSDSAGIRFREDGGGSNRIYSSTGAITLTATSLNATRPAIYAVPTPPVYLGWDGGTNISSGDLTIRGSATVANGLSLSSATRINGNGGNLTIGSTGGGLSSLTLPSGVIAAGSLWNNVTIGDASTGSIAINGNTFDAAGAINITGSSYSFANANTLRSSTLAFGNTNGIANTGTLTLEQSGNSSIANAISGTNGNLVKAGAGTTVLTGNNAYTGTTTIGGGTLQIGDGGTTGTLGTGTVTDNGTLVFNRSDAITVSNAIGGTGSVRKEGTGGVTLTGANSYSGGTTVNAGTLTGRGGGGNNVTITPFGSGSIAVAAGATAVVDNTPGSGYNHFNNEFTGAGTVSYRGSSVNRLISSATLSGFTGTASIDQNVVQLWGANTTATLNVGGGTFSVWSAFANPTFGALTGNGTVAGVSGGGGGTLSIGNGGGSATFSGVISDANGQVSLTKLGAGTQSLTGSNTYSGTTTISGGTLQIGNGGTTGTLGTGAITDNANLVFNRSDTITVANAIGGTGTVTQAGSGTTILTANNSYSGATSVNGGTLAITNASGLGGTNAGTTVASGATLDLRNIAVGAEAVTLNGGTLATSSGTSSLSGDVALGANSTIDVTGTQLMLAGVVSGSNGFKKTGIGTATVTGTNTYGGTTTVDAGVLQVGNGGTTGTLGTSAATINAAGTLRWFRSDLFLDVPNSISGTGTLSFLGTGTSLQSDYLPSGNNSGFTGTVIVDRARLQYDNANDLGTAAVINVLAGGQAYVNTGATLPNAITLNGTGWVESGTAFGALRLESGANVSGNVNLQSDTRITALNSTGTISGVISGAGNLVKTNLGTVILAGNNTYTGTTTIHAGTLAVTSASGLGSTSAGTTIANGATLDLRNVALDAETITLNGSLNTTVLTASTGSSSVSGDVIVNNIIASTANRVAAAAGAQLTLAGVISGVGSLTKTDAGTVVLSGNNTYTGVTNINAGTLQVGGGGATGTLGSGAVTVASGADLIFNRSDSVSLSGLAANAGGITGAGDVTALIGGDFNVDRAIALSGANSTILLEAGKGVPAGTIAGGNVTLSSNVSTSATGTLSIFSGNATTGAYEAMVSGADGPMRYKTYGASAGDTAGAITGTRNYYYRQQPSALTVSGLTATKVYDGLLDASAVVDGSGAIINGALDGDTLSFGDFTLSDASFDSAHAGTRGLNVSFSGTYAYTGSGNWSVSGADYTLGNYFNATAGTITPKTISASINPVGKTYDGLTGTGSTLSPAGFVGNDDASGVTGFLLAFDDPNAGTRNIVATGTGALSGFSGAASGNGSGIGTGNEVAGLASDYAVTTPTPVSAVISRAPLTITANNDAKIITQGDTAGYNGASYSGFVNGETSADLTGTLSITRSNPGTEAAGTYTAVLVPAGYTSGNYEITYANGNFQILPAEQLLVRLQNVSNSYGTAANYVVTSAEYLDGNGATLRPLTQTAQNGNTYTFSDGLGGSITFTVAPTGAITSSAGHLSAGNYALSGTNASVIGSNFSSANYVGNQTVTPIGLTPLGGVSKVYDGTTSMTGVTLALSGALTGDAIWGNGSGAFLSRNAGSNLAYDINNITLGGADAGNYYLTSGGFSGIDGIILPRDITVGGILAHNKVYDGTTAATLTTAGATLNSVVAGDAVAFDATSVSALFANKNAGAGKAVTVTGLGLSGADAGNYTLLQPTGLTANITPAPLTVTAVTNSKTYDGTTSAGATPLVTNGGLMAGDRFTALFEQYDSPKVGVGRTLSPLVTIEDGNGGANYAVTLVSNTTGEILPGIDLSQVGGTNAAAKLNASIGDHRRRRELDEEHLLPSVRVIATGLKLPEGMAATGYGDLGDFAN